MRNRFYLAVGSLILTLVHSSLFATEHEVYKKYFPNFAMVCAASQRARLDHSDIGGGFGHAVIFLQGACRDKSSADYPRITANCSDNDREVGISTDSSYGNVNVTFIPGYELFIDGNLSADQVLDNSSYDQLVDYLMSIGVFKGVRPGKYDKRNYWMKTAEEFEKSELQDALGTDFALTAARNLYCQHIPLSHGMIEKMVEYFNSRNDYYRHNPEGFDFSFEYNNCSHTLHNALAAAGIWPFKKTSAKNAIERWANIAIPANEVALAFTTVNEAAMPSVDDFYFHKDLADLLVKENFVAVQPGTTFEFIPAHGKGPQANDLNKVFDVSTKMELFEIPFIYPVAATFKKALGYNDLFENVKWMRTRYQKSLKDLPNELYQTWMSNFDRFPLFAHAYPYRELVQTYGNYLQNKISEMDQILNSDDEL